MDCPPLIFCSNWSLVAFVDIKKGWYETSPQIYYILSQKLEKKAKTYIEAGPVLSIVVAVDPIEETVAVATLDAETVAEVETYATIYEYVETTVVAVLVQIGVTGGAGTKCAGRNGIVGRKAEAYARTGEEECPYCRTQFNTIVEIDRDIQIHFLAFAGCGHETEDAGAGL